MYDILDSIMANGRNTVLPIGGGLQGSIGTGLHSFNFNPWSECWVCLGEVVEGWDFICS